MRRPTYRASRPPGLAARRRSGHPLDCAEFLAPHVIVKITVPQYLGSVLLLACMIFATANLESADRWVGAWLPLVIAGVVLVFLGTLPAMRSKQWRSQTEHSRR